MKKLYLLTTIALVALAACDKEEMLAYLSDPDAVRIEAAVGALTKSNPLGTVDEQRKFNEGDRISVTNAGKTVVYVLKGGKWAPENPDEYLKWDKSDLNFTAKYPTDYTSLPSDQSTVEKLTSADYMSGRTIYPKIPDDRLLYIVLERQNVLVKVKIDKYQDQYKEGETFIQYLTFGSGWSGTTSENPNMVGSPLIHDGQGHITSDPYYDKGTVGYTYTAIMRPNVKGDNSSADFIRLCVTGYGITDSSADILKVKGGQELLAGHSYTFNLIVGKGAVKIGRVTVEEWTPGGNLPDGETDAIDTWDDQTTEAFATKDAAGNALGETEDKPILIRTAAQLAYLAQQVNRGESYSGKYFKLTDDLNLAGHSWTPIGRGYSDPDYADPFSGIFDGDGHEIMGLKVVDKTFNYLGLFGYIKKGNIKNLKISSADINSTTGHGAILCGVAENSQIDNCSVSGTVTIENKTAGGVVAYLNNSGMSNCTAEVNVKGSLYIGGLCGLFDSSEISGCTVLPGSTVGLNLNLNTNEYPRIGGLVGMIRSSIIYMWQIGDCSTYATVSGLAYVGGAIGYVDADKSSHHIANCKVYGNVSVNWAPDHITDAYKGIGGFIGSLSGSGGSASFSNCGFDGTVRNSNGESFSKGSIYGAFVGHDDSKATFEDCWYNADKAGELDAIGDNNTKTGITAKN